MSAHTCFQCEHGGNTPDEWYGSPELAARADERAKCIAEIEALRDKAKHDSDFDEYDDGYMGALRDLFAALSVTNQPEESNDEQRCGDWPAPCNCDDPETHNGHNNVPPLLPEAQS